MIVERWTGVPLSSRSPKASVSVDGTPRSDGLLLVGHGSRCRVSERQMYAIKDHVQAFRPDVVVEVGFLEMTDPPAGPVLDRMVAAGCQRIVILPLMLLGASHSKSDVPAIVLKAQQRHPTVTIQFGSPLGVSPELIQIGAQNLQAANAKGLPLLVIARGTSEPDANGDAVKAARLLAEWSGTDTLYTGFTGVTWPLVPDALATMGQLAPSGFVVFFWFLCNGKLVERSRDQLAEFTASSSIEVTDAGYFGPDPGLAALVDRRYRQAQEQIPTINCDTCTYRAPFPGYEDKAGQPIGVGHSHLAAEHNHPHHY